MTHEVSFENEFEVIANKIRYRVNLVGWSLIFLVLAIKLLQGEIQTLAIAAYTIGVIYNSIELYFAIQELEDPQHLINVFKKRQ